MTGNESKAICSGLTKHMSRLGYRGEVKSGHKEWKKFLVGDSPAIALGM